MSTRTETPKSKAASGMAARLAVAWSVVGVPLAYGIYQTAKKAAALFA